MTRNTYGGGAQTNINGLRFEKKISLDDVLKQAGYDVVDKKVYANNECIGLTIPKHSLYKELLNPQGINYKLFNSVKWLPDECFVNYKTRTAYIIEKKFQNSAGSVDEKLASCDFKRREYIKLFSQLGYRVEYIFVFSDWFMDRKYKDVLDYIKDVGCHYYFDEIPLSCIGL
jgi:hypothetical protein